MRVGIYVDGFNLYYGARGLCGRGEPGWRWIDLRALATNIIDVGPRWEVSSLRVVYCTARVRGDASKPNASGPRDQNVYLRALSESRSADVIELGTYVARVATAPLATANRRGRPIITRPQWPVTVRSDFRGDIADGMFMASVARREEKGSDVNVATHLLIDVMSNAVDAAIVISNDSDLALPLREMRKRVPVGVVNSSKNATAGDLRGDPLDGAGGHWWSRLGADVIRASQLPVRVGHITKPDAW